MCADVAIGVIELLLLRKWTWIHKYTSLVILSNQLRCKNYLWWFSTCTTDAWVDISISRRLGATGWSGPSG